jgi:hypothetical protein
VGQTSGEIREQIDQQREQLGQSLQDLELRVKETVDWRAQFEQRPMAGLGMAFGAGFLLAMLMPGGDDDSDTRREWSGTYAGSYAGPPNEPRYDWQTSGSQPSHAMQQNAPSKPRSPEMNEIAETVDNIKGALLGLAATRLRSFLAEAMPGFKDEYEQAARQRGASSASRIELADAPSSSRADRGQEVTGHGWPTTSGTTGSTSTGTTASTPGTQIADTALSGMNVPTAGDTTTQRDTHYRS